MKINLEVAFFFEDGTRRNYVVKRDIDKDPSFPLVDVFEQILDSDPGIEEQGLKVKKIMVEIDASNFL